MRCLLLASLALGVSGHGYLVDPPPRAAARISGSVAGSAGSCALDMCFWFSQGCSIGCPNCTGLPDGTCGAQTGRATLPDYARSFHYGPECGSNPWCAPGSAPVLSPCGIAGGANHEGIPGAGGSPPYYHKIGEDGRNLPELPQDAKTVWKAKSEVEVQWAVIANHGGGYQYRLCKKSEAQTEECFQRTPMPFAGEEQWIQYANSSALFPPYNPTPAAFPAPDPSQRHAFKATIVTEGTVPKGSAWMRNPIPACVGRNGGAFGEDCGPHGGTQASDYQFPPPAGLDGMRPGLYLGGFGAAGCYGAPFGKGCGQPPYGGSFEGLQRHLFAFNIVDRVTVPDVPPGDYILSFRWDCEQTPQIWNVCADVTIAAADEGAEVVV